MGMLIDGKWEKVSIITSDKSGSFARKDSVFRNHISKEGPFLPEANRYHLYVSYACPWAHRTLIYRVLKGLEDIISVSVVHPDLLENGWSFDTEFANATGDDVYGHKYLYQIYQKSDPKANTKVTVPVLWDKKEQVIVNNESSEIIRMFNSEFNDLTGNVEDYCPAELKDQIDELNTSIYDNLNNGVYKAGFAKTQEAYDQAVQRVFTELDQIEDRLRAGRYVLGDKITEADIRLVTTLLRFDLVYYIHFKCSFKMIKDYPHINRYLRELYQIPAILNTTHLDHIVRHYYYSHHELNPQRIVPYLPESFLG